MPIFDDARRPARADALEQALRGTLDADETLLWSGFPPQGILLRPSDWLAIPFSLLWGGFAIAWELAVFVGEPDVPDQFNSWDIGFALWGVPFVLVGLYLIAGRFFIEAARRAYTIYAVTDQRAIVLTNFLAQNIRSIPLSGLTEIGLSKKADGRGTIALGRANTASDWAQGRAVAARDTRPQFESVSRAEEVLKIIREAQKRSRA
jgi:hypothetical protein